MVTLALLNTLFVLCVQMVRSDGVTLLVEHIQMMARLVPVGQTGRDDKLSQSPLAAMPFTGNGTYIDSDKSGLLFFYSFSCLL